MTRRQGRELLIELGAIRDPRARRQAIELLEYREVRKLCNVAEIHSQGGNKWRVLARRLERLTNNPRSRVRWLEITGQRRQLELLVTRSKEEAVEQLKRAGWLRRQEVSNG